MWRTATCLALIGLVRVTKLYLPDMGSSSPSDLITKKGTQTEAGKEWKQVHTILDLGTSLVARLIDLWLINVRQKNWVLTHLLDVTSLRE